jgi:spore germination protein Q
MAPSISNNEEQSYIENILRFNRGKLAKLYMTFPDSAEWRDKVFTGIIEHAGRDNIVVSDPNTGLWYLLLRIYLDYVEFEEPITFTPGVTKPGPGR